MFDKVSFVNTGSLTYFFFYVVLFFIYFWFLVFYFFLCVCAIPRKWLQMKSNHVVIIGKRKQVIQSSERLQLEPCYILAPVKISLFLVVTERSNAAIQLFNSTDLDHVCYQSFY